MSELRDAWESLLHDTNVLQADTRALVRVTTAIEVSEAGGENGLTILQFWKQRAADLQEALEGMCYQFGYWSDGVGGVGTGGLSALELAFEFLGWGDPHPVPEMRCKVEGCLKQNTVGWPCLDEGHRYHRTCGDHWRSMEGAPHEATP